MNDQNQFEHLGEETRAVFVSSGLVRRKERAQRSAVIAVVLVSLIVLAIVLDLLGFITIPGSSVVRQIAGVQRTEPASTQGPGKSTLTEAEKAALRRKMLGENNMRPVQIPTKVPIKAQSAEKDLALSVFNDERKSNTKVELKPVTALQAPNLPSGLTRDAIFEVIAQGEGAISLCIAKSMRSGEPLKGKMEVEITIETTGRVSSSRIQTAPFSGSVMGNCTAKTVRRWRFPGFQGDAVTVVFPYVLSAGL